ncbi:MAG: 16S rRNA (adenine(1518)-N(6)/adenine(1519)-N(6))-dimethyltransferase RsmA [Treponema sp.]|jgi:16S rRNA (adenine1518-N6/adenine1519-N6)-dimethyltransferase|nr:16S rRNA (adenine(1518)-N(6)/adenine(1519)-N(6))-dimethyltransferase RsmA [Treponema sp.]
MINYNSALQLRNFLDSEGLAAQKKFGQNFLINGEIRNALAGALNASGEVWEIGPGLGAMTAVLLDRGIPVRVFEIDQGFIRVLKRTFGGISNFSLVEGDVMKTWQSQKEASFMLGNLPYNIAAVLLADFVEKGRMFKRMVVTVQKEVALRMAAAVGSPDYSSFSALCASAYNVKPLMTIHRSSFYPKPNVDSMGVLLESRNTQRPPEMFFPLLRALFSSRRKTVKNNLCKFIASCKSDDTPDENSVNDCCAAILAAAGLKGGERAEILDPEAIISLARNIDNMRIYKQK